MDALPKLDANAAQALRHHLASRRSALSITLEAPGPAEATLRAMLTMAARTPDHGKLAPWRFEVWSQGFRERLHGAMSEHLAARDDLEEPAKKQAGTDKLLHAPTVVAVVSTASEHPKIPEWEQVLSAGAVCMNLLHAANAHGFGAQWLTAWFLYDERAAAQLELAEGERVAGLFFIGTSDAAKAERDRPDVAALTTIRD